MTSEQQSQQKDPLSARQRCFVLEYVKDLNGAQAAIRAGYSPKGADVQASRLLGNAKVMQEIVRLQAEASKKHGITRDMIINEYRKVAFLNPRELYQKDQHGWVLKEPDDISDDLFSAIGEVAVTESVQEGPEGAVMRKAYAKLKPLDKLKALDSLVKLLGFDKPEEDDRSPKDRIVVEFKRPEKQNFVEQSEDESDE